MTDSLLQAIIGGNPLGLPGMGSKEHGLTIVFPLSLGGTVNDLAHALHVPVELILAVNPGLRADNPLSVSQVVGLPEAHVEQIMRSVRVAGDRAYVTPPASSPPPVASPAPAIAQENGLPMAGQRGVAFACGLSDLLRQSVLSLSPVPVQFDRWTVGVLPMASSDMACATPPSPAPAAQAWAANAGQAASMSALAEPMAGASVAPVSNLNLERAIVAAASPHASESSDAFSYMRSANVVVPAAQDRQRNPLPGAPPPPPLDDRRFAAPLTRMPSANAGIAVVLPIASAAAVPPLTDRHPMSLQLMALLLMQAGNAGAAATTSSVSSAPDPQALAALAANLRINKTIELGAGRSLTFTLVDDRLRRIDPVGQERAAPRRNGDGLQEVRVSFAHGEEAEQTDEQREQGRRRRAAIAAMRRRRRPRTRRCRYWRGSRRALRPAGTVRYPKQVDLAEFRRRLPPRYQWHVGGKPG
jgi:hypothetical protein